MKSKVARNRVLPRELTHHQFFILLKYKLNDVVYLGNGLVDWVFLQMLRRFVENLNFCLSGVLDIVVLEGTLR